MIPIAIGMLDESLPVKLKNDFGTNHEVWTVKEKCWLGQKNGSSLKLMNEDGFDLFITVDRNLPYQQNLQRLPLTIFVLCAVNNRYKTLAILIPKLLERLKEGNLKNIIEIS